MLNFQTIFEAIPGLYLVLTPDFVIVAASDAYLQATMRKREEILDRMIFDAYPDNPDDPDATGVQNLRASLESVLKDRKPHTMAVQKYDIRRLESEGGGFEERYWTAVNSPVFDANGEITQIIHRTEDVTEFVRVQQQKNELHLVGTELDQRLEPAMSEQTRQQFEYYYPAWNRWFENRVYLIPDAIAILCAEITERKQAEAALREREQQLRLALKTSKLGSWQLDLKTNILSTSDQCKMNFGLSIDADFSHQTLMERIHPEDQAWVQGAIQESIVNRTDYDVEYRNIWTDGSTHWVLIRGQVVYDSAGNPLRMMGMSMDITDRKQAEIALRESERRFRRLVESNLFGVVFGDCFGKLHYANDYFLNLVGYTPEEVYSGQVQSDKLTPPEFAALDAKAAEQLSTQGVCPPYEKVYLHKDGRRIPILIAAALVQEPFNINQEVMAFVLDLSKQKQLRQERDRLFNLSLDMLAIGNFNGYFTQVNPAWEKTLGFTQTELTTQPYLAFVHPDDRAATLTQGQKLARGRQTVGFENRFQTKDGSYKWISWNVVCVPEQNVLYAIARDITDRKQTEQEREQLFMSEQAARSEAERLNRIKDEFLAVLSHELRSPLNPILGWSKLLQNGKLSAAKTSEALATIERNAKLQVQLIDDLLDVSRILRGKLVLNAIPVELGSVISGAIETVRLAADAKSLQVKTQMTPGVSVIGDATRLQQIVWNLLSNAVKFTPRGGQIEVNLTPVGTNAQIQVTDTGKGIRAEFLPHVFDRFQQEDGSTTRKFGGLGLGLAIVRQIVEMHGGKAFVESLGEGQGATFTVEIPLAPKSVEMPQIKQLPQPACDLSGIQILVVDDDPDSRELIAFVLKQQNASVTAVSSGSDALEAFSQSIPNIVVSDIGMPEIDGYMLMREIRMLPPERGGRVPAIAITAYAGELDQQQAINAGFQRHIPKPISPNAVIESVVELVRSPE